MPKVATVLAAIGIALLLVVLTGLIVRRRWSLWYSFTTYLPVMALFSVLFVGWPQHFYAETGWLVQNTVINGLRFAMALELAARTFHAFPGARSTLRWVLLSSLALTLLLVLAIPGAAASYTTILTDVQPRLLNGTLWLFTVIAALILWYRLPVAAFHKSILLGYIPYLLFELIYMRFLVELSWRNELVGALYPLAYLPLTAHWAWVAWRVEEQAPSQPPSSSTLRTQKHLLSQLSEI